MDIWCSILIQGIWVYLPLCVCVGPGCDAYSKYVYRNGVWIEETPPEKFEPKITNLLVRNSDDVQKYINFEEKAERN